MTEPSLRAGRRRELALALSVAALTLLAFVPSLRSGWVDWDDAAILRIDQAGSVGELLRLAFTDAGLAPLWVPATWLSLRLDVALFGPGPFGHHLVNALLHAVNAALLVALGARLAAAARGEGTAGAVGLLPGRALAAVGFAALAWGLHPLRVESVSWLIERKDVLGGTFSLLATLAYLRHASRQEGRWPWAAFALHACALAAKPTAVVLPAVWLLLDVWPLRRWSGRRWALLSEKGPMLLSSVAIALVTLEFAQSAIEPLHRLPLAGRLLLSAQAPFEYVRQSLWPSDLHGFRPLDLHEPLYSSVRLARAAGTVILTAAAAAFARRAPGVAAGWAAFLVLLVPNHALQSGPQELADRFTYLAAIPLSLMAGAALERVRARRLAAVAVAVVALAGLAAETVRQQRHWRDAEALWTRNVQLEPRSGFSWARLSRAHLERGELDGAILTSERAVRLAGEKRHAALPKLEGDLALLLATRARAREASGRREEALADVERALALVPAPELLELRAALRGPAVPGAKLGSGAGP